MTSHDTDPFYILAPSPQADDRTRVLKQGDTFAVLDRYGDVKPVGLGEEGIYHEGTRFLSCLLLRLGQDRPLLLSSTVKEENDVLVVDLTNPDILGRDGIRVARGLLHLFRSKSLWQGVAYECLHIRNYGLTPVTASFSYFYQSDFADIFEVRGSRRRRRGRLLPPKVDDSSAVLAYEGLDGVVRRTRLEFSPAPARISGSEARFEVPLAPRSEARFYLTVSCETPGAVPRVQPYEQALKASEAALRQSQERNVRISSSNEAFNAWVNRAAADLHMMITCMPMGPYPYAGVPWYSTPFGRDGILTAFECLWLRPDLARGVLAYLAATQAHEVLPEQDAEPGKILHETRSGEMAALGEIPFGRYYGSVDATPLFIMLAGAYHDRTNDRAFIESIWPNIDEALAWIDIYGDADQDGFVEYQRHSKHGLVQQGWKDSQDSVFHADGTLARGPIALCEVQGYVYAAKEAAAAMAYALGNTRRAGELLDQAQRLHQRFEQAFWCDDISTYALALDGDKRPCRVRTSNAGHCLLTGIATQEHARRTAATLMNGDSYSGWGIRTVARAEARYNPMSYHNGSVWPHDNALIAFGMARYGFQEDSLRVMDGLLGASTFVDLHRLPELFCGFNRRRGEGPTLYPVACAPQAWSAAAVFLLVQACLGLEIKGSEGRLAFSYPVLPEFLRELRVDNLRVGEASVDLLFLRHGQDVGINVLRRQGKLEISMTK
jgi:glycogen debranching enzyme